MAIDRYAQSAACRWVSPASNLSTNPPTICAPSSASIAPSNSPRRCHTSITMSRRGLDRCGRQPSDQLRRPPKVEAIARCVGPRWSLLPRFVFADQQHSAPIFVVNRQRIAFGIDRPQRRLWRKQWESHNLPRQRWSSVSRHPVLQE